MKDDHFPFVIFHMSFWVVGVNEMKNIK